MWGQDWNTMIWGALALPLLSPLGLLALVLAFVAGGALLTRVDRARGAAVVFAVGILAIPVVVIAAVPHVFVNGEVADADEVNENFAAVHALTARSVYIDMTSGTPLVLNEYGDWVGSVTAIASDEIEVFFDPPFAAHPVCVCSTEGGTPATCNMRGNSTTSGLFRSSVSNHRFDIICQG